MITKSAFVPISQRIAEGEKVSGLLLRCLESFVLSIIRTKVGLDSRIFRSRGDSGLSASCCRQMESIPSTTILDFIAIGGADGNSVYSLQYFCRTSDLGRCREEVEG